MKYILIFITFIWLNSYLSTAIAANNPKSVNLQQKNQSSDPYSNKSKISDTTIKKIKPLIKDWLDYYHLDIANFYTGNKTSWPFDKNYRGIYTKKFESASDDVYIPQMYDYSPSKQKYISFLDIYPETQSDKYIFYGNSDCQEIYLIDRKNKTKRIVLWLGLTQFLEAIFWLDEDHFIAVGYQEGESNDRYFMYIFSPDDKMADYYFDAKAEKLKTNYFYQNLNRRGVIID